MHTHHVQMTLAAADYYKGGIDGNFGPKSKAAMYQVEQKYSALYSFKPQSSTLKRRMVACAQACLEELKYDPGVIDGWEGNNTEEALNAFLFKEVNGQDEVIERAPLSGAAFASTIPHQNDVGSYYGQPKTPSLTNNLVTLKLPFKFRIDYNLRQKTNKVTVHKKASDSLERGLIAVHNHYGETRWRELGLDRYAGAYNPRRMRGGSKWSMHAYGCAIDFYAAPNGLRMKCPEALFCGAAYKPFLDIMEQHEWLPAIRLWGKDAMHFQRARL